MADETVETPTTEAQDPWLDDQFAPLDTRKSGEELREELAAIANEDIEEEEAPIATPAALAPVAAEPVAAPAAVQEDEPQVKTFEDGSSIEIEKTKTRGWKATLRSHEDDPRPEVFYGRTKDELLERVMHAKINATRKIREQNRTIKLGVNQAQPAQQATAPTVPEVRVRELTADEKFEIQTKLQADPDLAMQEWFQKKTGRTLEQLVALVEDGAKQGQRANAELESEAVAREFMQRCPDYLATVRNYQTIIGYLAKHKLGLALIESQVDPATRRVLRVGNEDELKSKLYGGGFWTTDNFVAAFEELMTDGLLESAPPAGEDEEAEEVPAAPARAAARPAPAVSPAAAPAPGATPRVVRRPRAALGIRTSETTTVRLPDTPQAPSAEELESLSDKDVDALFAGVRQARLNQARR
jgi:hypothetical protein